MVYDERHDGRDWKETRPITAKVGIVKEADGSASFSIGKTTAYAAVYGPRELHPKFLQNPTKGILRCNYSMMPFSGQGERVRPGPNRRAKELSRVIELALEPVVDLSSFPNSVIDIFIDLPQTDAGTRCAGVCAASLALADAGIVMSDLVTSVSVGIVEDKLVVDLDYAEEAHEPGPVADIPVALVPSTGQVTLLQMDGLCAPDRLKEGLEFAKEACEGIKEILQQALHEKFKAIEEDYGIDPNEFASQEPDPEPEPEQEAAGENFDESTDQQNDDDLADLDENEDDKNASE